MSGDNPNDDSTEGSCLAPPVTKVSLPEKCLKDPDHFYDYVHSHYNSLRSHKWSITDSGDLDENLGNRDRPINFKWLQDDLSSFVPPLGLIEFENAHGFASADRMLSLSPDVREGGSHLVNVLHLAARILHSRGLADKDHLVPVYIGFLRRLVAYLSLEVEVVDARAVVLQLDLELTESQRASLAERLGVDQVSRLWQVHGHADVVLRTAQNEVHVELKAFDSFAEASSYQLGRSKLHSILQAEAGKSLGGIVTDVIRHDACLRVEPRVYAFEAHTTSADTTFELLAKVLTSLSLNRFEPRAEKSAVSPEVFDVVEALNMGYDDCSEISSIWDYLSCPSEASDDLPSFLKKPRWRGHSSSSSFLRQDTLEKLYEETDECVSPEDSILTWISDVTLDQDALTSS